MTHAGSSTPDGEVGNWLEVAWVINQEAHHACEDNPDIVRILCAGGSGFFGARREMFSCDASSALIESR